jgi:capsid portal protein
MSESNTAPLGPPREEAKLLDYMKFGNGSVAIKENSKGIYMEVGKNIARKDKGEADKWVNYRIGEKGCVEAMAVHKMLGRFLQLCDSRQSNTRA